MRNASETPQDVCTLLRYYKERVDARITREWQYNFLVWGALVVGGGYLVVHRQCKQDLANGDLSLLPFVLTGVFLLHYYLETYLARSNYADRYNASILELIVLHRTMLADEGDHLKLVKDLIKARESDIQRYGAEKDRHWLLCVDHGNAWHISVTAFLLADFWVIASSSASFWTPALCLLPPLFILIVPACLHPSRKSDLTKQTQGKGLKIKR